MAAQQYYGGGQQPYGMPQQGGYYPPQQGYGPGGPAMGMGGGGYGGGMQQPGGGYGYPQQGYPQQGQPAYGNQTAEDPGKTLGIIGLVLSFFTALIGLVVSIVALRKSKKAGFKNTPALIGIIVGALSTLVVAIITIVAIAGAATLISQCAKLGPGVHEVNGVTVTCNN